MALHACESFDTPPGADHVGYQITPWERNVAKAGVLRGYDVEVTGYNYWTTEFLSLPGTNN